MQVMYNHGQISYLGIYIYSRVKKGTKNALKRQDTPHHRLKPEGWHLVQNLVKNDGPNFLNLLPMGSLPAKGKCKESELILFVFEFHE